MFCSRDGACQSRAEMGNGSGGTETLASKPEPCVERWTMPVRGGSSGAIPSLWEQIQPGHGQGDSVSFPGKPSAVRIPGSSATSRNFAQKWLFQVEIPEKQP